MADPTSRELVHRASATNTMTPYPPSAPTRNRTPDNRPTRTLSPLSGLKRQRLVKVPLTTMDSCSEITPAAYTAQRTLPLDHNQHMTQEHQGPPRHSRHPPRQQHRR
ncbi:Hypothetical predicted protein [Pelobates cultripes]|uniref:Uncharacterized protein n=1 Tax=Pelobates cultripes TaxID=61616 RepID=A0AAD1VQ92_PELCU|nr:Hypothetical predicted protein [Pelobates cultripes]